MDLAQTKKEVLIGQLSKLPVLNNLGKEDLEFFLSYTKSAFYEKGSYLFHQGDTADKLFCLINGTVKVYKLLPDGTEKVLHMYQAPQFVAEAPVLCKGEFPAEAECIQDCSIITISRESFLEGITKDPELPLRMMAGLFGKLREFTELITTHGQKSAQIRVLSYFAGLSGGCNDFILPSSKKDVANYLGLRPESFSRVLSSLQDQNVIVVQDNRIHISDPQKLYSHIDSLT